MNKRDAFIVCILIFLILSISFAFSEEYNKMADKPTNFQKIKLWLSSFFGANRKIITEIENKYYSNIESIGYTWKEETRSKNFKFCENGNQKDCKSEISDSDFDNLDLSQVVGSALLVKRPNKYYSLLEIDDYKSKKMDQLSLSLCQDDIDKTWDNRHPSTIIEVKVDYCSKQVDQTITEGSIFNIIKRIRNSNPEIREINIKGRKVIEISLRSYVIRNVQEKDFLYFDAETLLPIQFIMLLTEKYGGKYESIYLELTKRVITFNNFRINDIKDEEFTLPKGDSTDIPDLRYLNTCSYTFEESEKAINEFINCIDHLNKKEFREITKDEFNKCESLRISIPRNNCLKETARSYEEFMSLYGKNASTWGSDPISEW